jgi:hypothetical protein
MHINLREVRLLQSSYKRQREDQKKKEFSQNSLTMVSHTFKLTVPDPDNEKQVDVESEEILVNQNIIQISGGHGFCLFLTDTGEVYGKTINN